MFNPFKKIDITEDLNKEYYRGVTHGRGQGYELAKAEFEGQIEQRVVDKYSQVNYLVNPSHVFQVSKTGIPYLGLEPITKDKLKELQIQAKSLLDTELWSILTTMIRSKAVDKAIKESTEWNHVLPGKMMVHNISLMESLLDYLSKVDLNSIPDAVGKQNPKVL